jgi:hypothetical protein
MSVGMPQALMLEEFGQYIYEAFGTPAYHVGSSLTMKTGWRDVDVRLVLDDKTYSEMGLGFPEDTWSNGKWVSLVLAFSALGKQLTGLPIDFQIQQQSYANKNYNGRRSTIGMQREYRRLKNDNK